MYLVLLHIQPVPCCPHEPCYQGTLYNHLWCFQYNQVQAQSLCWHTSKKFTDGSGCVVVFIFYFVVVCYPSICSIPFRVTSVVLSQSCDGTCASGALTIWGSILYGYMKEWGYNYYKAFTRIITYVNSSGDLLCSAIVCWQEPVFACFRH